MWRLASIFLLLSLAACDSPEIEQSNVEIHDPEIDGDICAAVYFYAQTVLELGRGEFRINGHLWRSYSPLVSDKARLLAEFSPNDFTSPKDITDLLGGGSSSNLFYRIDLDGQEPAEKLFLLMDLVEDSDARCWINWRDETIKSSVRIYTVPKNEAE